MAGKPTVLIFGATGKVGSSIVNGLLASQNFKVAAAVRAASNAKAVADLRDRGVVIHTVDLETEPLDEGIHELLRGVDVVISAVVWSAIKYQKPLIDAAKQAGVKRFIPCDWGTPCVRGVRALFDEKLDIQEYVKQSGVPYTIIDTGTWYEYILPPLTVEAAFHPSIFHMSHVDGIKSASIDLDDVGTFVARIIADERTLNRYVLMWAEEFTKAETFALVKQVTGVEIAHTKVTEAKVLQAIEDANHDTSPLNKIMSEYFLSLWIRGDNTIENAKKPEYGSALDARELYPDIRTRSLLDFAREFYAA